MICFGEAYKTQSDGVEDVRWSFSIKSIMPSLSVDACVSPVVEPFTATHRLMATRSLPAMGTDESGEPTLQVRAGGGCRACFAI